MIKAQEMICWTSIPFSEFSKIDELAQGQALDATTILRFRHFLEEQDLARQIFETVVEQLEVAGLLTRQGTIVDSTNIQSPSSTKNKEGKGDLEMHQNCKRNSVELLWLNLQLLRSLDVTGE